MKAILYATTFVIVLAGCAPSIELDLNIENEVTEELPREMAIEYLTEITQRYPVPITQRYLKPWNNNCKCFDDYWIVTSLPEEKHSYTSSYMTYWTMNNPGYNQLVLHLVSKETDESCELVNIRTYEPSDDPSHKELFIKVGKKVATALKSLGVEINRQ